MTPSTTSYQTGDLVLISFPFTAGGQSKVRPALVLLDTGDADILVARVSAQPAATRYDVVLADWRQAGLLAPSVVRLHKLATLEKSLVNRLLGRLDANDHQQVAAVFQQLFAGW